ncbi:hypothetical protein, partial [Bacillus phage SPG24]
TTGITPKRSHSSLTYIAGELLQNTFSSTVLVTLWMTCWNSLRMMEEKKERCA